VDQIRYNLAHLTQFGGRETRSQFWPFVAAVIALDFAIIPIAMIPLMMRMQQVAIAHPEQATVAFGTSSYSLTLHGAHPEIGDSVRGFSLAIAIMAAVSVALLSAAVARRLHDAGRAGFWGLLPIPFLFSAMTGMFIVMPTLGSNQSPWPVLLLFANNLAYNLLLLVLAVLLALPGTKGPNRYGDPVWPDVDQAREGLHLVRYRHGGGWLRSRLVQACPRWRPHPSRTDHCRSLGVAPDELRAEVWLKKAFEAGSLRSLLTYGKLLAWRGDMAGAEAVFASAAGEDWAPALYWLASTRLKRSNSPETLAEARSLLERAAAQGHPAASWRLGKDMCRGRYGLQNIPRGFGMLAKCATETLAAWESRGAALSRATSSGETIH
jgi:uncharacterized membrane protein YhaH (DUF805 family)